MNKIERIKNLTELLNKASDAYYNTSRPTISDLEFDRLYDELRELEKETNFIMSNSPTINVGFEVKSKLDKVEHSIPLLSLNKTKDIDEFYKFVGNQNVVLMYKADGLTHELVYNNGELLQASTRGNGIRGELVTHNAKTFKNIPLYIDFKGYLKISGEAIILDKDFELINSQLLEDNKYSNSRNLVAGSVRQLDSKICNKRNVRFYSFSLIECKGKEFKSLEEQFQFLENLGFNVITRISQRYISIEPLEYEVNQLKEKAEKEGFPIDGIVAAYNDLKYANSLGNTSHHPLSKLSFKFYNEEYQTKYIRTEWDVSRTGIINPIGVFESVNIDGADITRATLHNIDYFKALKLGKDNVISVIRANQVIPKIVGNETKSDTEEVPEYCPICGAKTEIRLLKTANVLYCTNDNCPSKKIAQFTHYVSRNAMNIDGLSEKTIEKFINAGFLKDLSDIYRLEQYKDKIIQMDRFGQRSYTKLIQSIEKSKKSELSSFIFALGIPNVGLSTAKDLVKFANCENPEDALWFISTVPYEYLINMKDCGDITANNIVNWFKDEKNNELIDELLKYIEFKEFAITETNKEGIFTNKKIYCTGSFAAYKKNDLKKIVEDLGGTFANGYAKSLDYLVVGSVKGSSKEDKAKKDGVPIISENEFIKMIKEG